MVAIGWADVVALLTSVGFGALSAVVPVANAEAYVAASQGFHAAGPVAIILGVALGQTIGKLALFYGVRRGRATEVVRHRRAALRARPVGPMRARFRAGVRSLLTLVGQKRWGLPITFAAAVLGLPPLYAVALLAGATRMRIGYFGAVVLVGRTLRFLVVAYGVSGLAPWRS